MQEPGHRRDIDGLRMVAVIPVVLYHAGVPGFSGGFVGVDVFFVISGFLITGILRREIEAGRFSIAGFYERRVRRILPALLFLMSVCLVVGCLLLLPRLFSSLAHSVLWTLAFASNVWFYHETLDYFAPAADHEFLLHTWSLAVEEQFYIGYPLVLWFLMSKGRHTPAIIVVLCALSFGLSVYLSDHDESANFYLAPTRMWELGVGACLALLPPMRPAPAALAEAGALAGAAALALSVAIYTRETPFPGAAAALPCFGAGLILWAGGQRATLVGRGLSMPLPVGIGLISYSLYLWHWPILVLARFRFGTDELPAPIVAGALALSVLMAWISWRFVERPFRNGRGRRAPRTRVFAVAAVAVAAVAVPSVAIVASSGLPARLPTNVRQVMAVMDEDLPDPAICAAENPSGGFCPLGLADAGGASVLLWGDSHAGSMAHGLDLTLRQLGLSGALAYKLACPPILGVERIDNGIPKGCAAFSDQVMAALRQRSDLGTVILYSRWTLNSEGRGSWPRALLRAVGSKAAAGGEAANFAVFRDHFAPTIRAILATGRRVIIVKGTPELGFDLPVGVARARMIGTPVPPAPDADAVRRRNARTNAVIAAAVRLGDVTVVDPVPILCTPRCATLHDGRLLYRDSDHLSFAGSDYLAPRLLGPELDLVRRVRLDVRDAAR